MTEKPKLSQIFASGDYQQIKTAAEFKAARHWLELSVADLAHILNIKKLETVRKWESPAHEIGPNPVACRVLAWMIFDGFRPPETKGM